MPLVDMNAWLAQRGLASAAAPAEAPPVDPPLEDQIEALQATIEAQNETIGQQANLVRQLQAALRERLAVDQQAAIQRHAGPRKGRVIRHPRKKES